MQKEKTAVTLSCYSLENKKLEPNVSLVLANLALPQALPVSIFGPRLGVTDERFIASASDKCEFPILSGTAVAKRTTKNLYVTWQPWYLLFMQNRKLSEVRLVLYPPWL